MAITFQKRSRKGIAR